MQAMSLPRLVVIQVATMFCALIASFSASADTGMDVTTFESLKQSGQDVTVRLKLQWTLGYEHRVTRMGPEDPFHRTVFERKFTDEEFIDRHHECLDEAHDPEYCAQNDDCFDCDGDGVKACRHDVFDCVEIAYAEVIDICVPPGETEYKHFRHDGFNDLTSSLTVVDSGEECTSVLPELELETARDADEDSSQPADADLGGGDVPAKTNGDDSGCGVAGGEGSLAAGLALLMLLVGALALVAERRTRL